MIRNYILFLESVRNRMTPMSADDIDSIINNWTPREKFLKGFTLDIQYLKDEGRRYMKDFKDVQIGDLLTIAVPKDANQQPLCKIKEKYTFNNKEEFKDYLREHPSILIDSNSLKTLFKSFPNVKRDVVVVNHTFDMMFEYGRETGVFPYTEREMRENISKIKDRSTEISNRFHDEYLAEGVRDKMTPKSEEEIRKKIYDIVYGDNPTDNMKYIFQYDLRHLLDKEELEKLVEDGLNYMTFTEQFFFAVDYDMPWIVKKLIEYGYFSEDDDMLEDAWLTAKKAGKTEIADMLFKHGKKRKVFESVRDKMTPKSEKEVEDVIGDLVPNAKLEMAVENGVAPIVQKALDEGADIKRIDRFIFSEACSKGYDDVIKVLIDNGIDVTISNNTGLKSAVWAGKTEVVKLLLDAGADVHTDDENPLGAAVETYILTDDYPFEMIELLLDYDATVTNHTIEFSRAWLEENAPNSEKFNTRGANVLRLLRKYKK